MRPTGFGKRQIILTAALILPLGLSAYAISNPEKPNAALQASADDAALAGINSLAASATLSDEERVAASVAAARQRVAAAPAALQSVSTSPDGLTVSVVLGNPRNTTHVTSTAHYVPPDDVSSHVAEPNSSTALGAVTPLNFH